MSNNSKWYLAYKYWKKTKLSKFQGKPIDRIFKEIYEKNLWRSSASISGKGSDDLQTKTIIQEIPKLLSRFSISSMHDIPCGDFNWMSKLDLDGIAYLGSDIVPELIESNNREFARDNIVFNSMDLTTDSLPEYDFVFIRDCLVHLSYADTIKTLTNIIASRSRYLLTTSFVDLERNYNIATGEWRPINLERPPYDFPPPIHVINENCTQDEGAYPDKSLLLWEIKDLSTIDFLSNLQ
jgi:hypothetical protein